MYGKIFSDIFDSSIMVHGGDAVYVFIALIVLADPKGHVRITAPALANRIGKPLEVVEKSLRKLESPDSGSTTPTEDGKRIIPLRDLTGGEENRGWWIVNYELYRNRRDRETQRFQTRERVRKHRDVTQCNASVTLGNASKQQGEEEGEEEGRNKTLSGKPDPSPLEEKKQKNGHQKEAKEILEFLNTKTGKNYQPVKVNLEMISARIREGYSPDQLRQVVAKKCREWLPNEKMAPYLRPKTLFNRTNFANYAGELVS